MILIFFFVDLSSLIFPCGVGGCTLVIREDLPELETAAMNFEQHNRLLLEELQQSKGNEDLLLLSTMFPVEEYGYFPFCDIDMEVHPHDSATSNPSKKLEYIAEDNPILTSTGNTANLSDTPLSMAASTIYSFRVNDSIHPNNVRLYTLSIWFPVVLLCFVLVFLLKYYL